MIFRYQIIAQWLENWAGGYKPFFLFFLLEFLRNFLKF